VLGLARMHMAGCFPPVVMHPRLWAFGRHIGRKLVLGLLL